MTDRFGAKKAPNELASTSKVLDWFNDAQPDRTALMGSLGRPAVVAIYLVLHS